MAIIQTIFWPMSHTLEGKTLSNRQLQSIKCLRDLVVKHRDAAQKQLIALLFELNIKIAKRRGIISAIENALEDCSNGLSTECRRAIYLAKEQLKGLFETIKQYNDCIDNSATAHQ